MNSVTFWDGFAYAAKEEVDIIERVKEEADDDIAMVLISTESVKLVSDIKNWSIVNIGM